MDVENLSIQHHVMAQINYDGKYYSIANFWLKLGAGIQAKKDTDKTSNSLSVQYNNTSSPDLTFAVTAKSSVSDAPLTYRWFWYDPSSANTSHEVSGSSSTYTLTETGIKQNRVYVCVATDSYGNTGMVDFPISVTLANETVTKTKAEGNNAFNATVNNEDGETGSSVVIVPATDNSIPNDTTIAVTASAISENPTKVENATSETDKAKNQSIDLVTEKKSESETATVSGITTTTTYTGKAQLLNFTVTGTDTSLEGKKTEVRIPWPSGFNKTASSSVKFYYIDYNRNKNDEVTDICIIRNADGTPTTIIATMPHFSPFLLVETTVATEKKAVNGNAPSSTPTTPSNNNSGYSGYSGFGGGSGSSSGNAANDDNTSSNETPYTPTYTGNNTATQNGTPVTLYRMYNPNSGEHIYTTSKAGADMLTKAGWRNETASATAWKSPVKSACPIYQFYNPNSGFHHYSMTQAEIDMLTKAGWKLEGVAWYGLK